MSPSTPIPSRSLTTFLLAAILASSPTVINAQSSTAAAATPSSSGSAIASPTAIGNPASVNLSLPQTAVTGLPYGVVLPDLSLIVSGATTLTTVPLDTTYAAGAQPTAISSAPVLPTVPLPVANYPALDLHPPTNSSEVQAWIAAIDWSGVPGANVTTGACSDAAALALAGAANNCWWTCGQCTRSSDITVCPDKYDWGLSYDDGPTPWTPLLLDYLNEQDLTTTFFVVGSRVLSYPAILQSEYMAGHQISVHTWSHPYLTTLSNEEIVAELGWSKKVIKDVIGVTPNTFRPPYGDIDDRVRYIAAQMGLTPIIWSQSNGVEFDTSDWNIPAGTATGESAFARFESILEVADTMETGFIVLQHDLYPQTVELAVGYILPYVRNNTDFKMQSISDCLGWELADAYIETSSNDTTFNNPEATGGGTSFSVARGTAVVNAVTSTATSGVAVATVTSSGAVTTATAGSSGSTAAAAATTSASSGATALTVGGAFSGAFALGAVALGAILLL